MRKPAMQEQRRKKALIFSLNYHGIWLKRSGSMQHVWIIKVANGHFEQERKYIEHYQHEYCRSAAERIVSNQSAGVCSGTGASRWVHRWGGINFAKGRSCHSSRKGRGMRFQASEQPDLIAQFGAWMHNLKKLSELCSRSVIPPGSKLCHFS